MATVAAMMYGSHRTTKSTRKDTQRSQPTQAPQSMIQQTQQTQLAQPVQMDQQQAFEYLSSTFCRALYDFETTETYSLSFRSGDIIEVLTKEESGWWDGYLRNQRGWFPSNFVEPISDAEAEAELSRLEYSTRAFEVNDSGVDINLRIRGGISEQDPGSLPDESTYTQSGVVYEDISDQPTRMAVAPNDFWLPEVDPNGMVFYVNPLTGERSRDLPTETNDEMSENDMGHFSYLRSTSRTERGVNNFGGHIDFRSDSRAGTGQAGFGISKRSGTPEPWTKRLADDGLTYYYFNKITGQITWTRPGADSGISAISYQDDLRQNGHQFTLGSSTSVSNYTQTTISGDTLFDSSRLRSDSMTSQGQHNSNRDSVYSDDSDIQPRELDTADRTLVGSRTNDSAINHVKYNGQSDYKSEGGYHMTNRERLAIILQEKLSPAEPESIDTLSDITHEAIIVVMAAVDDNGLPKGPNQDKEVEVHVASVVVAVRNLLYVSGALSGSANSLVERNSRDPNATAVAQQLQAQLKTSQRKVTATLSKLVLSARAARYKREGYTLETMRRVEQDATELQHAVDNFVSEVKKQHSRPVIKQLHQRLGRRRLHGVFDPQNLGPGLPGGGAAGSWKGFGFINIDDGFGLPKRPLAKETIAELRELLNSLEERFRVLSEMLQDITVVDDDLLSQVQSVLAHISTFVLSVVDINISQEIDIDGLRDGQPGSSDDPYMELVGNARTMLRNLESNTQCLYDGATSLLLLAQTAPSSWSPSLNDPERIHISSSLLDLTQTLKLQAGQTIEYLEGLQNVAREQTASEDRFRESLAIRISRISIMDSNQRLSNFFNDLPSGGDGAEDVVDMEIAFRKGVSRPAKNNVFESFVEEPVDVIDPRSLDLPLSQERAEMQETLVMDPSDNGASDRGIIDDDFILDVPKKEKPAPPRAAKIRQLLGDDAPERYIEFANDDSKPWYLRAEYNKDELVVNPDGGIRAGTLPALVERLTTHDYGDAVFIRTFLMTYKSFTTLDELFDLLVKRYFIQPPDGMTDAELQEWTKLKQHVIRSRVLNTFKTMVTDDQVLVDDDLYILDRIKNFLLSPEVAKATATKNLVDIIERKKQGSLKTLLATLPSDSPPPSIIPKGMNKNKLKILDIDPLEIARQLTLMESALYKKIKAIECLQRAREQKVGEHRDHITDVIQMTNKIANWVNSTILSKEDSRKRAALVKQFISIADRCRGLHNFSSMAAIISGLNSPPIRRLKRTWEQVNGRYMAQLGTCEMTLDSTKNFTNYKATLAQVNPPCIPFIGVYLTTLIFIQDGGKDMLGNLINFGKRQRAAEIIREIQHWQSKDFHLSPLPPILAFIEEALSSFSDSVDWAEQFWNLSLEREPREREDEKMARLLQESGFL